MLDVIKDFCGIPENVSVYDSQIISNAKMAEARLKAAGVSTSEENELVKDYISTFCRLRLVTEPTAMFTNSENGRLRDIIVLLTYGGYHDI